jgi:mono/diheme cytochrome c family protein
MKRAARIIGILAIVLIAVAGAGITVTIGWRPFLGPKARPLTNRKFEATPERLQRGEYIANYAAPCMACHTPHDWSKRDAPMIPGMLGAGGPFPLTNVPGKLFPPNLTPDKETGAGTWTDDQLARAIREGVGHDGRALFPAMPYGNFRTMSDEDLASVIVYLRSLKPVHHVVPKSEIIFPVKYLIRNEPQPVTGPVSAPPATADAVTRGKYVIEMASCRDCHTPRDSHGHRIPGMDYAGGEVVEGNFVTVASMNLTTDPTGIPYYTKEMFIQTIRTGKVGGVRELSPIMPWHVFRGMTDEDLGLIFDYLRSVEPVKHSVDNTEKPTYCRLCRQVHGLGEKN